MELIDLIPEFNLYEEYWKIYTKSDNVAPQYLAAESKVDTSIIGEGAEIYGEVQNSVIGAGVRIEKGAVVHRFHYHERMCDWREYCGGEIHYCR